MKQFILTFLIILSFGFLTIAQEISVTKEESDQLNSFANSIRNIEQFGSNYIFIKLFECGRSIGSYPGLEGMDIILFDFYISVKERTEELPTTYATFWVDGDFHNPRNYQFEAELRTLTFEHGTDNQPKATTLTISTTGIQTE